MVRTSSLHRIPLIAAPVNSAGSSSQKRKGSIPRKYSYEKVAQNTIVS
uniref:Uncharacterized protein n=1 Tax=uncultured Desulfobacterium sp. TaxID=201089 RepID=E1YMJ8_9BACT|nr:unknown protein [uncultured Desulfobacterium sp.]